MVKLQHNGKPINIMRTSLNKAEKKQSLIIKKGDISNKKEAKIINLAIHLEKLTAQLSDGLTRTDAEKWLITGLTTTDYKFIDLLISEGVKFTQFNDYDNYEKERLKKLFDDLSIFAPKNVTKAEKKKKPTGLNKDEVQLAVYARNRDAQGFLDQYYPKNGVCLSDSGYNNKGKKRSEITQLDISKKKLIGDLDLSDFVNLRRLACNSNQLTRLFLSQNKCSDNKLTELIIPEGHELKILEFKTENYNDFIGSLESLRNCTKLDHLNISDSYIEQGLEYLNPNIKYIKGHGWIVDFGVLELKKSIITPFLLQNEMERKIMTPTYQQQFVYNEFLL
ncbi:13503_t:CDS:2 [Funneliformis geosporum]|nr:13503_t:CDS:2 [Funneliformis geosporum]